MNKQVRYTLLLYIALFIVMFVMQVPLSASEILVQAAEVVIQPGQDIQAIVDSNPAGTTYILKSGIHRMQRIRPKDNDVFVGEDGAVLNGSRLISNFILEGNYWVITDQTQEGESSEVAHCEAGYERCFRPEDVFVNDSPLRHVNSLEQLTTGTFYFDYAADKIYLYDDPAGRKVETSVSRFAFDGPANSVTIRNLTIEKYSQRIQLGAVYPDGSGWLVENNLIQLNHAMGVRASNGMIARNNRIINNGELGAGGTGENIIFEGNEIAYNNFAHYNQAYEAGGSKMGDTQGLIFRNNHVHHNNGPGLWSDVDSSNTLYENNLVEYNAKEGIFYEISQSAIIRNNVVRFNSQAFDGWLYGSQILLSSSANSEVYNNHVTVSADFGNGISIIQQNRGSGVFGERRAANNYVHDNTIVHMGEQGRSGMATDWEFDWFYNLSNNKFDHNTYYVTSASFNHWDWSGQVRSIQQMRDVGQEMQGQVILLSAVSQSLSSPSIVSGLEQAPFHPKFAWTRSNTNLGDEKYVLSVAKDGVSLFEQIYEDETICQNTHCEVTLAIDLYAIGRYMWQVRSFTEAHGYTPGIQDTFTIVSSEISTEPTVPTTPTAPPPVLQSGLPPLPQDVAVNVNHGNPFIQWTVGQGVSWFYTRIIDSTESMVYEEWVRNTEDVCVGSTCTFFTNAYLTNGNYQLYLVTWNSAGYGENSMGPGHTFRVNFNAPQVASPLTTTYIGSGRPTFNWQGQSGSTWYQIWIGTPGPEWTPYHFEWYSAREMGCENAGVCTLVPNVVLDNHRNFVWYVRSWGPGGYSTGGLDGWMEGGEFIVDAQPPQTPEAMTPTGTLNTPFPTFYWGHQADASWYQVEIHKGSQTITDQWYPVEALNCRLNNVCEFHLSDESLPDGQYTWQLQPYTPAGLGTTSDAEIFKIQTSTP